MNKMHSKLIKENISETCLIKFKIFRLLVFPLKNELDILQFVEKHENESILEI